MRNPFLFTRWGIRIALAFVWLPLLAAWTTRASGDMSGIGPGGLIPNNNPTGVTSIIAFAVDEAVKTVEVSIDFGPLVPDVTGHSHVGDLSATLTAPDGRTISLFHRPGVPATTSGDNSNLAGVYRWADGGVSFTSAAAAVGNLDNVANATYEAQAADDTPLSFETTLSGASTAGHWTLHIIDAKNRDGGGFVGWSISIASSTVIPVPETSSTWVLVVASIIAARCSGRNERERCRRIHRAWY